jgi:hypothetical protein
LWKGEPRYTATQGAEDPAPNDLDEAISSMLKEKPYLSCKVLCPHFRFANGTCLRILHDVLGMKKFHLRWVSHALDTNQKAEKVTLSRGIHSVLQTIRSTGFQSVITGHKSWFFLCYPRDPIFNTGVVTR